MTTRPQDRVLLLYYDLFVRKLLVPSEQKLLRLETFLAKVPTELIRFAETNFLPAIGTFFMIHNNRQAEAHELDFTTAVTDYLTDALYEEGPARLKGTVMLSANALNLSEHHVFVALALYVKHLGLCHVPPILRWHDHEHQTLVWDKEAHRRLLQPAESVAPTK